MLLMVELSGLKVLVVEDEGAVALLIEDMLADLGCEVTHSAAHLAKACELASSAVVDFALLDLNLNGSSTLPVASILKQRGIPFVFCTGYGTSGLTEEFASYPTLVKPFVLTDLRAKVSLAVASLAPR